MAVENYDVVAEFIEDNVYHSELWDELDTYLRKKAVNNADNLLRVYLPDIYGTEDYETEDIEADVLAYQSLWILRIDDTIMRAEQGVKSVWVDGTMISIMEKDNSVCPYAFEVNNIAQTPKGNRRKVGAQFFPSNGGARWGNEVLRTAPTSGSSTKRRY